MFDGHSNICIVYTFRKRKRYECSSKLMNYRMKEIWKEKKNMKEIEIK